VIVRSCCSWTCCKLNKSLAFHVAYAGVTWLLVGPAATPLLRVCLSCLQEHYVPRKLRVHYD
jgi:hypothetical protein